MPIQLIGLAGRIGSGKDTVGRIIQYLVWTNKINSSNLPDFKTWDNSNGGYPAPVGHHQIWQVKKFAAKLKEIASILTGVPIEVWEDQEFKNKHMGEEWRVKIRHDGSHRIAQLPSIEVDPHLDYIPTYREFLQVLGTQAIRNTIHPNTWVNALFADYYDPTYKGIIGGEYHDPTMPSWIITDVRFPNELEAIKSRGGMVIRMLRNSDSEATHESETALDNAEFDYTINNSEMSIEQLIEAVRQILMHSGILKESPIYDPEVIVPGDTVKLTNNIGLLNKHGLLAEAKLDRTYKVLHEVPAATYIQKQKVWKLDDRDSNYLYANEVLVKLP